MSLAIVQTWGPEPPDELTKDDIVAFVTGGAAALGGTVGTTDIAAGAVTAPKTTAGPHFAAAGVGSGSAPTTYAVTLANAPTLATYLWFWFIADIANTGTVKVNANGTGAKFLKKLNGADMQTGDIIAGTECLVIYNGTDYLLASPLAKPNRVYAGVATGTSDVLTLTLSPVPANLAALTGIEIEFTMPASANTTNVTLNPNALGATAVTRNGATALVAGELAANQVVRVVYDGTRFQVLTPTTPAAISNVAVVGAARNLVVRTGSPAASRLTVAADEIVLKTSAGLSYLASGVSTFADLNAALAGGLDTGVEAISLWYYFYVIYNPSTGTINGLLSLSATAPTLPAGYTYKALVGVAYNDSASDFIQFQQYGTCVYTEQQSAFSGAAPGTTFATLSLTAFIPPIARLVRGIIGATDNISLRAAVCAVDPSETIGLQVLSCGANSGVDEYGFRAASPFAVPIRTASQIQWKTSTTGAYLIYITGYDLPS